MASPDVERKKSGPNEKMTPDRSTRSDAIVSEHRIATTAQRVHALALGAGATVKENARVVFVHSSVYMYMHSNKIACTANGTVLGYWYIYS